MNNTSESDAIPSKRSASRSSWFGSKRIKELDTPSIETENHQEVDMNHSDKTTETLSLRTPTPPKPIATTTTAKVMVDKSTPPLSTSAGSVNSWFRLHGKASKPDLAAVLPKPEVLDSSKSDSTKPVYVKSESLKAESIKAESIKSDSTDYNPPKRLGYWSNSSKGSISTPKIPEANQALPEQTSSSEESATAVAAAAAAAAAMPPPPLPSAGWFGISKKASKDTLKNVKSELPQRSISLPSSPLAKAVDVPNESITPIAPITPAQITISDTTSDQTPLVSAVPVTSWWSYVGMGPASDPVKVVDDKPASVKSAESAIKWPWFGTWTGGLTTNPTAAEQVKADAINSNGKLNNTEQADAPPAETTSTSTPAYNPISSSARSNRSSWAYFFTSNSNLQPDTKKKITEGEQSSMEVMTVPSAEELAGTVKPNTTKVKGAPPKAIEAPKPIVEAAIANKPTSDKPSITKDVIVVEPDGAKATTPKAGAGAPRKDAPAPRPNVVLPAFEDVFGHPKVHRASNGVMSKTLRVINNYIFNPITVQAHEATTMIPQLLGHTPVQVKKAVVIGIHGWIPSWLVQSIFGAPTGTSVKFRDMMVDALKTYLKEKYAIELPDDAITAIALEGEGKVEDRVTMHYTSLLNRPDWMKALEEANVILFSTHSQGSIVTTFLISRLIDQKHIHPERGQRICAMMMCGIHHGPFTYLNGNVVVKYLEAEQARELFEFQDSDSRVHRKYVESWRIIIRRGVKLVYVSSMADNVVPIYSAIFDAATHPSILRAIFIDGTTYNQDDFLTNLIVFCLRLRNAGLSDHGLLLHLSDILVGSIYGDGHSLIYFDSQVYHLAIRYLFETTPLSAYDEPIHDNADGQPGTSGKDGYIAHPMPIDSLSPTGGTYNAVKISSSPPVTSPNSSAFPRDPTTPPHRPFPTSPREAASVSTPSSFRARTRTNPYYLPWAMRGVFDDPDIRRKFGPELERLMSLFEQWDPQTKALKDVRYRLEPLRRGYANTPIATQKKAML